MVNFTLAKLNFVQHVRRRAFIIPNSLFVIPRLHCAPVGQGCYIYPEQPAQTTFSGEPKGFNYCPRSISKVRRSG